MLPVLWWVVVAATVAVADQAAKRIVSLRLAEGERRPVWGGAELARITNRRGGLVRLSAPVAAVVAAVLTGGAAVAVVEPGVGAAAVLGLGLIVGGVVSNVTDRVRRGGVVDLFAVGPWPVFNLADAALVVGALVVLGSLVVGP